MALNNDGFEGGAFLTLEQQAELRAKQHAASQEETESAVSVKRKRKTGADKLAVVETTEETAESE
jgi:hypothetical protein